MPLRYVVLLRARNEAIAARACGDMSLRPAASLAQSGGVPQTEAGSAERSLPALPRSHSLRMRSHMCTAVLCVVVLLLCMQSSNPLTSAQLASMSGASKGWPEQNLSNLDASTLTPLSPVVMHRQATINIGTIGHVAHGKR